MCLTRNHSPKSCLRICNKHSSSIQVYHFKKPGLNPVFSHVQPRWKNSVGYLLFIFNVKRNLFYMYWTNVFDLLCLLIRLLILKLVFLFPHQPWSCFCRNLMAEIVDSNEPMRLEKLSHLIILKCPSLLASQH